MRQRTAARVPRGSSRSRFPQVRQAAETFASKLFPRVPKLLRTAPLKALVIGAFVWGPHLVRRVLGKHSEHVAFERLAIGHVLRIEVLPQDTKIER